MKSKHCQWCDTQFETSVSYQIYCSVGCREASTKEKISQRYAQTKRNRRLGKVRKCKACGISLSIYNDHELCSECDVNPTDVKRALKEIKGFANGKSE